MTIDEVFGVKEGEGGFHSLFDIEQVRYDGQGRVCVDMRITAQVLNPYGKLHGGAIAALGDIALGSYYALKKIPSVALSSEVHYYRPGEPDTVLTAVVNERKLGRTISDFLIEMVDNNGKHIADVHFSSFCK